MINCRTCTGYDQRLDALIYQSKVALSKLSDDILKSKMYGYSCDKKANSKSDLLQKYLYILEDENRKAALGGNVCLTGKDKQSFIEKVTRLTVSCDINGRSDLIVDNSNEDVWIAQNPGCITREKWEKFSKVVCGELNIEVVSVEKRCDFSFEIIREVVSCDVLIALSIYEQMCDLNLKVNRSEDECKVDFNILINEIECDLDFKTYKKLIDCNLSFDIIKSVYENECSFTIGDDIPILITKLNSYPLSDFNLKDIKNIESLGKFGVNTSSSEFVKNPGKFINNLKQDYSE